jgi:hypothetical protein
MSVKRRRFPHLGELSVAILEFWVAKAIGEAGIETVKEPLVQKQLEDSLIKALQKTEERLRDRLNDQDSYDAILSLAVSDSPMFQEAVWDFYQRPTDPKLGQILWSQLAAHDIALARLERTVNTFIDILREEFIISVPEIREVLSSLASVQIQDNTLRILRVLENLERRTYAPTNIAISRRIISFDTLMAASTERFVGRAFVFDAIDSFIQDNPSGYFVFIGDPGIGKTALISQLVRTRDLVHHFNVIQENIRSPYHFITNVCAQLITRFDLGNLTIPTADELHDSVFLTKCLEAAAAKCEPQPLIIALDSLDEADRRGLPEGANVHYLPRNLPQGVYFVVTTRSIKALLPDVMNFKHFRLDQNSAMNVSDIRQYVSNYAMRPKVKHLLSKQGIEETIFVNELVQKSQGNFMYLRYILPEIEQRDFLEDGLDQLPVGLEGYYTRHWKNMQSEIGGKFQESHEMVISILAAMPEPVPLEAIAEWTKLPLREVSEIKKAWEPFLFQTADNDELRYRIYHHSFGEFLSQQVNLDYYKEIVAMAISSTLIASRS